ncbi:MAG: hypothetical protein ABFD50_23700 [Smithella sp.]
MELDELLKRKRKLQNEITSMINNFMEENGDMDIDIETSSYWDKSNEGVNRKMTYKAKVIISI